MSVYTNPPDWEAQGKKPPSSKRTEGWKPGDRVPASWLNWFWFSTVNSLREIAQAFVSHVTDKNNPHGVTVEQIGAAPPDAAIPIGGIIMWSGSVDSIPPGWALCDGRNGTPDLRDRFIVGAGGAYNPGNTGGAESVTLTVAQMPQHNHSASCNSTGAHTHNISISSAGGHSHSASSNSTGAHEHKAEFLGSQIPSRRNRVLLGRDDNTIGGATKSDSGTVFGIEGAGLSLTVPTIGIDISGNHQHDITVNSAGAHTHSGTAASAGAHSHSITVDNTGSGSPHENRPPYYALCFIMKL